MCSDQSPAQASVSLSVYEAPGEAEEEVSLTDLFPDPADFVPPSPTFTFPPLPPTPPDQEEPETVTESTGRTEIEVHQHKTDLNILNSKNMKQENVFQESITPLLPREGKKEKSRGEKKKPKTPESQHQLPVPTVQITQQGSSEREILDSIALTKTKLGKKEEKHSKSSSRKNKRRKEKKENARPAERSLERSVERSAKPEKEFCEKCYEKKLRRKIEREQREILRAEEQIVFDPQEPFVDRHIEEAEVLRRYIDTEKVYDDTISIKSYCACSLHAEEIQQSPYKLSQQKMEQVSCVIYYIFYIYIYIYDIYIDFMYTIPQVRDAVLVVRNWKHSAPN